MAQTFVQLPDDTANTGKKEDHWATATNAQLREAVVVADPSVDAAVSKVINADPATTDYGVVVRPPNTNPLDYDTGGGTVPQTLVGIALPASGGPVGVSTSNPFPITTKTPLTASSPTFATVTGTSSQ